MLHCPQCGAEYREGYSSCSDCHVLLVRERPVRAEQLPLQAGDPNKDPFRAVWYGNSVRYAREYSELLERAGIPFKVIHREDHLFNLISQPKFEVVVSSSFYEAAMRAVEEKYGTEEEFSELGENEEVPVPEFDFPGPPGRGKDSHYDPENWFPEDATVPAWTGDSADLREMIEMSLRENEILARWGTEGKTSTVFVQPNDEGRAKEIVREIVETTAPE
jgi:hypothetical protein